MLAPLLLTVMQTAINNTSTLTATPPVTAATLPRVVSKVLLP